MTALLDVRDLSTEFSVDTGTTRPVDRVSFSLERGEVLGLVGESGSGKTVTALSLMRLITAPGRIAGGQAFFEGRDIFGLSEAEMIALRGNRISMIFQQPRACLNPVLTVGVQMAEIFRRHRGMGKREALNRSIELLARTGMPAPERKAAAYPHELSGGQAQRVMIAMALALEPQLLIADEPTTALDVTIQSQILALLADLCRDTGTAMILVTHDLGVVAQAADRVAVMYAGQIVESRGVEDLFDAPAHPYTRALLEAIPVPGGRAQHLASIPGTVPAPGEMPRHCRFAPRCSLRTQLSLERCTRDAPPLAALDSNGAARCWALQREPV